MLQALRRAEEPGESAARRCSLTYRLRALQENLLPTSVRGRAQPRPAVLTSPSSLTCRCCPPSRHGPEFFEWLERQAALSRALRHAAQFALSLTIRSRAQPPAWRRRGRALHGAAFVRWHARLPSLRPVHASAGQPWQTCSTIPAPAPPFASNLALRLFGYALQVAQPTPFMHQLELRRSQGFAMGPYNECLRRIEGLYKNILDITGETADADDHGNEGVIERRGCVLWAEGDHAPAVVLPAPLSTHLYMSLLSCRFDADEPTSVVWNSGDMIRLIREVLQPVVLLSDAEHYACTASVSRRRPCARYITRHSRLNRTHAQAARSSAHAGMLHTTLCQLQYGLDVNLPELMPQLCFQLNRLQTKLRSSPAGRVDEEARGCGVLLEPLALLVLDRLSSLAQLCEEAEQATLAALMELLAWVLVSPPCLLAHLGPVDAPWSSLGLPHVEDPLGGGSPDAGGAEEGSNSDFECESKDEAEKEGANPFDEAEHASWEAPTRLPRIRSIRSTRRTISRGSRRS